MKNPTNFTLVLGLLLLLFIAPVQSQNNQWMIDNAHTSVNFSIKHFFSNVIGNFTSFSGKINFDPVDTKGSSIEFTIPVKTVNTNDAKRDQHLQSADFFDATTYPNMKFVSTSVVKKTKDSYVAYGKLTIKNVSKDISLPFMVTGMVEHPMMKGTMVLGLKSDFKINRNDYGVGTGDWAATMVVGDEVNISINMEVNKTK